ncbi:Dehydrogenase/reductase SDR family member 12 [Neoconidiobolus thromboides FSU 785]|nr:Dehydrogenase/reductase SDR family member 12 [Neoconidiobolus thromboides FSU 785]
MSLLFKFPQFMYNGIYDYCQAGFLKNSERFNLNALNVDVKDKVFIVTGGSKGLGKVTAMEIAKRGGTVHILCRDEASGQKAVEEIKKEATNDSIFLHLVDLSSLKNLNKFYKTFNQTHKTNKELAQCDVLIHNAGFIAEKYQLTEEGIESSFAVNSLAPYYLTKLFLPNLEASKEARVIFVSSGGMYNSKLEPKDLQFKKVWFYSGVSAYAQNKRQQVEMAKKLSQVYSGKGIRFLSMHPGWCATPGVSKSLPFMDKYLGDKVLRTPLQGADTILWLALSKEPYEYANGDFFFDRKPVSPHYPYANTTASEQEVNSFISQCENLIDEIMAKNLN